MSEAQSSLQICGITNARPGWRAHRISISKQSRSRSFSSGRAAERGAQVIPRDSDPDSVAMLVAMGFDSEAAEAALVAMGGNTEAALEALLAGQAAKPKQKGAPCKWMLALCGTRWKQTRKDSVK